MYSSPIPLLTPDPRILSPDSPDSCFSHIHHALRNKSPVRFRDLQHMIRRAFYLDIRLMPFMIQFFAPGRPAERRPLYIHVKL